MRVAATILSTLAIVLSACAPATAPSATNTGGAQQPGDKRATNQNLVVAKVGLPGSPSPEFSSSMNDIFINQFDSLVWYGPNYEIRPAVAQSWEYLPATSSWRFKLRQDMTFSNGQKLTAEDVAYSINLIVSAKLPHISYLATLSGATVVDQYTVDLTTKSKDATIIDGGPWIFILPAAYHKQAGADFATKPIGSGPYELTEYRPADSITYKLRSTTHPYRKPNLSQIQFKAIPEKSQHVAGFQTGEIDVAQSGYTTDQVEQMRRANVSLLTKPSAGNLVIYSQPEAEARQTPLRDRRVREALNYALNKQAIADSLFRGIAEPVGQLGFPEQTYWDPNVKPYPYDPAKAKQLLAEAGYPNGFKLPVGIEYTPQTVAPELALAIQSALRDIGVEAEVKSYEFALYLDKLYGRAGQQKGDLFMLVTNNTTQNYSWVRGRFDCALQGYAVLWCNQEFNRLYDLALEEADPVKRADILRRSNAALREDVPVMYTIVRSDILAHSPKLRGVEFTAPNNYNYDAIYRVE